VRPTRVLAVGSRGFIASHFAECVAQTPPVGATLVAPWTSSELRDLTRTGALGQRLERDAPDVVINFAWLQTGLAGYETETANHEWADLSVELCTHAALRDIHFVGIGSCLELDFSTPETPYVGAKRSAYAGCAQAADPALFTWMRPFWVFSKEAKRPRVLADAFRASLAGVEFHPRVPSATHDFVEVRDVASALQTVIEYRLVGPQDVGSGRLRSVDSLVANALGRPPSMPTPEEPAVSFAGTSANIEALLSRGWAPTNTDRFFNAS
jgi:nucleoside-diphosphate-sugar epimerase